MCDRGEERAENIYLVVDGITGGVRGYSVPSLWVPWTKGQDAMVHFVLAGTDRSSHCERGAVYTSAKCLALNTSAVWSVTVSYCSGSMTIRSCW
jgi:hypothetical protein